MNYTKLKVGDVRQATDQVKRTVPYCTYYSPYDRDDADFSDWVHVRLVGHTILSSDIFVAEFRREVAVD
jgi:hypothetical protein